MNIIALVALYRPGPMSNIPIYNDCKNGLKKPDYIHPTLKKILTPTYGIIIYQEQKPNKFDDIIALVALYRPGPMSNI